MIIAAILIGLVALAGNSYLAIKKKSSFTIRIAALIALAVMIITVIICVLFVFSGETVTKTTLLPDAIPVEPPPDTKSSITWVLFLVIFLIMMFLVVLVLSLREQRRVKKSR